VRHIALPKPGDWRQFCIQAARIHARPLDLQRPLWEMYVIEGLDSFLSTCRSAALPC
jgi:diacylglycerol O-acyltransferase